MVLLSLQRHLMKKGQRGAELDLKDTYSYNAVSGSK